MVGFFFILANDYHHHQRSLYVHEQRMNWNVWVSSLLSPCYCGNVFSDAIRRITLFAILKNRMRVSDPFTNVIHKCHTDLTNEFHTRINTITYYIFYLQNLSMIPCKIKHKSGHFSTCLPHTHDTTQFHRKFSSTVLITTKYSEFYAIDDKQTKRLSIDLINRVNCNHLILFELGWQMVSLI